LAGFSARCAPRATRGLLDLDGGVLIFLF
jgi:hypothetical protein